MASNSFLFDRTPLLTGASGKRQVQGPSHGTTGERRDRTRSLEADCASEAGEVGRARWVGEAGWSLLMNRAGRGLRRPGMISSRMEAMTPG